MVVRIILRTQQPKKIPNESVKVIQFDIKITSAEYGDLTLGVSWHGTMERQ